MKKSNYLFPALALGLTAVSCQDYDAGVTADTFKKVEYAKNFEETFGKIDPNQDWSMAGRFTATVNLDENINGILSIYTKEPGLEGCYLLAKANVEEGQAQVSFDAVKGTKLVYAVIQKNGRNQVVGNYDVINGEIMIAKVQTRGLDASGVSATETSQKAWRMTEEAVAELVNSGNNSYTAFQNEFGNKYNRWQSNTPTTENQMDIPNLYSLSGQHTETGTDYTMEQLWSVFGLKDNKGDLVKEGVFTEGEDHINKYVKPGTLKRDASLVVAEDGEVTIELIWRGTQYNDFFGYFFYPEDGSALTAEKFWNTKKYILFGGDGSINLSSSLTQVQHHQAQNDTYGEWTNMDGMTASSVSGDPLTKMHGTKMNLVNFDAEGNPSYNFTAGTKIGFFLYTPHTGQLVFSDTKLNYQMNYVVYGDEDNDQVRPYAVTFNYKGNTFLGFADGCDDYDINDVVFGAFNVEEVPDITPETPDPEAQTWVVACEDLGGTFDYDFNDLVFGLRMTPNFDVTKSKLELIPLAAGGTLEAHILYGNSAEDMGEIHALVGGSGASTSTPLNVDPGTSPSAGTPVLLEKEIDSSTPIATITGNITIQVPHGNSNTFITSCQHKDSYGKAPQMILFPAGWDWPSENTEICKVYEDFDKWVADTEYTDWYKTPKESSDYVNCPLPKVNGGNGGNSSGGNSGGGTPGKASWTINIVGESELTINPKATETYIVTIDDTDDLSTLTCGVDNGNYNISVSNDGGTVTLTQGDNPALGTTKFWVSYPEDETHSVTKQYFTVNIVGKTPDFTISVGGNTVEDGGSCSILMGGDDVALTIALVDSKGDTNAFEITSDNSDVAALVQSGSIVEKANFYSPSIRPVSASDTPVTITVKHKEQSNYKEVIKTIKVTVTSGGNGGSTSCSASVGDVVQIGKMTYWGGENDAYARKVTTTSTSLEESTYVLNVTGTVTNAGFVIYDSDSTPTHTTMGIYDGCDVPYSYVQALLAGNLYITNIYGPSQSNAESYSDTGFTFTKSN